LMVRGFRKLVENGARFEPATLLTMRLSLTDNKYHELFQRIAYYRDILDRIQVLPGVRSAAAVTALPYSDHSNGRGFTIEGRPVEPGPLSGVMYQVTTLGYFELVHLPLVTGRLLAVTDGPDAPKVALISKAMADRWWKKESPLGKR